MKRFLLLALLALAPLELPARPAPKVFTVPVGINLEKDLAYIPNGDPAQKLDLYLPARPADQPLPLIVHIHGGGWRGGNKFPCPVSSMVLKGYVVASIEYRFSQKAVFPVQIQDCQAALRWLRAHSKEYNLDPNRVGVIGASAGGHLSALVGTAGGKKAFAPIGGHEDQSDRVQAVCDIYGPADFTTVVQQADADKNVKNIFNFNLRGDPYSLLIGAPLEEKAKSQAVSPVHYVSKDSPPFLILHGTHDTLVPYAQSEQLAAALKAKGVEAWLQKLPGSGHGGPAFSKPSVHKLTQDFFDKHLKGAPVKLALVPEADLAVEPTKSAAK